mgnify:CR=1 FL=1
MKRSELVAKIAVVVAERSGMHPKFKTAELIAEELLKLVEKSMIPKRRDHLDSNEEPTYSYTWDQE